MSKIQCLCGNLVIDNTDFISNKASFIADQDHFDLLDEMENQNWREQASILSKYSHHFYQCTSCQNVIFFVENERLDFQSVDKKKSVNLLGSKFGGEWKGLIVATYWNGIGEILWQTNTDDGYKENLSLEELRRIYFAKFEELQKMNILRSSFLRIDDVIEHDFKFGK